MKFMKEIFKDFIQDENKMKKKIKSYGDVWVRFCFVADKFVLKTGIKWKEVSFLSFIGG